MNCGRYHAQAIHIGATIGADIVKQNYHLYNMGFKRSDFPNMTMRCIDIADRSSHWFSSLSSTPRVLWQRSSDQLWRKVLVRDNLREAVRLVVINKRGDMVWSWAEDFQSSREDGLAILRAVQAVYLEEKLPSA